MLRGVGAPRPPPFGEGGHAALIAGMAKPLLTFELRTRDAGNETLILYPPVQGGVPARASGREVVLLLPADTLQQIQAKVKAVREAKAVKPEG